MIRLGRSVSFLLLLFLVFASGIATARPPVVNGGYYGLTPQHQKGVSWWAGTLSGTAIRKAAVTTSWFLYPGACTDRALGSWSAKTNPVADSLNTYSVGTTGPYTVQDRSLHEILWHVADASTPASERPAILSGVRSLWCGTYNPSWVKSVGYPDVTYQILYVDTGAHGGTYSLTMQMLVGTELDYDFLYLIGGGSSGQPEHKDPLTNRRDYLDDVIDLGIGGPYGDSELLVTWTGSITGSTPGAASINTLGGPVAVRGDDSSAPASFGTTITIDAAHRALYFVFVTDDHHSSQDGLRPYDDGHVFDTVATSDNGTIYGEQVASGAADSTGGYVIVGTGANPIVSGRVPAGAGELWRITSGAIAPTSDFCSPQKSLASDRFFLGGDPFTQLLIPSSFPSIVSCTFPIPPGTGAVLTRWNEYLDLPRGSGYVQFAEYRVFRSGAWSDWKGTSPSYERHSGGNRAWSVSGDYLAEAPQADSVQLRWNLQCVPSYSLDKVHCSSAISLGLLYDDLRLEVASGAPTPTFGIFRGGTPQTTFVDGTIHGTNCSVSPCWPGVRGTDLGLGVGIDDNVNTPIGDSVVVYLHTALRPKGMGINWRVGYDRTVGGGLTIAHTNGAFQPAFDTPRMIYRLFDPATKTWSPFDSTELVADAVFVASADTAVIRSGFRTDWPPFDKSAALLPGGFTINGIAAYSSLGFLPRGTRLQYYFKTVDILGGVSYQFSSDAPGLEVADLPTLPGGSIKAPDILEFQVLPGRYAPGPGGSLLAGRTDTPILNLDGTYTAWSFGLDPMTQAIRALGVRADRYRLLQGYEAGANYGGHELSGQRIARLSNYFPNSTEYPITDSLASWYRILIQSSHLVNFPVDDEQDAKLFKDWMLRDTGANAGDRCVFASGDSYFNLLLNASGSALNRNALAQTVFGVVAAIDNWSTGVPYPTLDDRFAAPSAGPALAPALTYTYPIDGGCAGPNRFDALTKIGAPDAQNAVFYPGGSVAGVLRNAEFDFVTDKDRSKAIGYGYSFQFIRKASYPPASAGYDHSGVENRMYVLYKFLTSCRGPRTGAPGDTGSCWPCPGPGSTVPLLQAEWATQSAAFQTATYGPLYPIQAMAQVTAVGDGTSGTPPAPFVNSLGQNRPNPFNPQTTIPFSLASSGRVILRIYDIAGRLVRTLVDRTETAGFHVVRWDGRSDEGASTASGVYFYRIEYPEGGVGAKKMILLR